MPALRTRDTQSRSTLEVLTDVPTPTLAIISPTPRAFTFPISHNLTDSPYSSPSHSPFEPDLRSLALTSSPPPFATSSSPSSSSSLHRRRQSSCSSDIVERRPKKGDDDYVKRPENAFILFRRKCCEDRQAALEEAPADGTTKKQRQADLSKTISQQWKALTPEERQYWDDRAKERKIEHGILHPGYVYRPQRKDGHAKGRKSKRRGDSDSDNENLSFVVPVLGPHQRHHGRSASAPTPPPYQSIQVPNVYQMTPSCPTSPSLLPMISRRSSHPDCDESQTLSFDFHPEAYTQQDHQYGLQSSEFLHGMFDMAGMAPRDTLHPLDITPSMLLPSSALVSPSSTLSSGPPSPHVDPLTPLHPELASTSTSPTDFELQMQMQHQQEFASASWDDPDTWPTTSNYFLDTDFDLAAIPPMEFDVTKCAESMSMPMYGEMEYAAQSQSQNQRQSQSLAQDYAADFAEQVIIPFDQMMSGNSF